MNGRSHSPSNAQTPTRLSRREKRKMAQLNGRDASSHISDEQVNVKTTGKLPRKPVSRIISLIQFLSSYDDDVGEVENALGNLQEKDQKIKSLKTTISELRRANYEEIQALQAKDEETSTTLAKLEKQKAVLKEDQEKLSERIKQEKSRQVAFKQQQQADFDKRILEEKAKLEKEHASRFEKLKEEKATLHQKTRILSEEKARAEKTLALYMQNSEDLESQVKGLESRYPTQSLPIEHYEQRLSKLCEKIQGTAQHFLSNLPPDDELNVEETQKGFQHLNSIFGAISLSASVTSKFLRICGAQSTIVHAIHKSFWQPFCVTGKTLQPEITAVLSEISQALAREDRHKESLWRFLTFKGLETPTSPQNIHEEALQIVGILQKLIPSKEHKAFNDELQEIFQEAITFWDELKRDSCQIEFDFQPPPVYSPGWVTEDCAELGDIDIKAKVESRDQFKIRQSWCLFPKVVFNPVDGKKKTIPGCAIFVDSRAFYENCDEIRRHEKEIAQVRKNLLRRPTLRGGSAPLST